MQFSMQVEPWSMEVALHAMQLVAVFRHSRQFGSQFRQAVELAIP